MASESYVTIFLILSAAVMLWIMVKHRVVARALLLSSVSGVASLLLVSLMSGAWSVGITFNAYSLFTSVIYGLPGVVGMSLIRLITG